MQSAIIRKIAGKFKPDICSSDLFLDSVKSKDELLNASINHSIGSTIYLWLQILYMYIGLHRSVVRYIFINIYVAYVYNSTCLY